MKSLPGEHNRTGGWCSWQGCPSPCLKSAKCIFFVFVFLKFTLHSYVNFIWGWKMCSVSSHHSVQCTLLLLHPCLGLISLSQCEKHRVTLWAAYFMLSSDKRRFYSKEFPTSESWKVAKSTERQAMQLTFPASFLSLLTFNERTTIIWIQPWQLISLLYVFCQVYESYCTLCPEQQQH